jgi:hypothetical protein
LVFAGATAAGCDALESQRETDGAGNSTVPLAGVRVPSLDELPAGQRTFFEDGTIDTREYATAFERFKSCANEIDEAVLLDRRDPVSGYIEYGIREAAGGPLEDPTTRTGRCYQDEFQWVELVWQVSDPTFLAQQQQADIDHYQSVILPCLTKNGISAPAAFDGTVTQEYAQLADEWFRLDQANKCE